MSKGLLIQTSIKLKNINYDNINLEKYVKSIDYYKHMFYNDEK